MCDDTLKELGRATQATTKEMMVPVEGAMVALREAEEDEGMAEGTMVLVMMVVRLPRAAIVAGTVQLLAHHGDHPLRPVMLTVSHVRYHSRRSQILVILDIDPPQLRPRNSLRETVPRAGPSGHSSSSQIPICDCGIPANKKRVTQKSAREGKQFYACAQDVCGFFKWIEGEHDKEGQGSTGPTPLIPAKRTIGASRSVSGIHLSQNSKTKFGCKEDQAVVPARQCRCKEDAVQRTVTKEGVNKGRIFWGCAKGKDEGCGFFEWDDEPTKPPGSGPPISMSTRTVSHNDPPSNGKCFKAGNNQDWISLTDELPFGSATKRGIGLLVSYLASRSIKYY